MITLPSTPIDERTKPEELWRFLRTVVDAVRELQRQPLAFGKLVTDVALADGVATPISHMFGRRARVFWSPPQGAALIEEVRDSNFNPDKFAVLRASGGDAVLDVVLV